MPRQKHTFGGKCGASAARTRSRRLKRPLACLWARVAKAEGRDGRGMVDQVKLGIALRYWELRCGFLQGLTRGFPGLAFKRPMWFWGFAGVPRQPHEGVGKNTFFTHLSESERRLRAKPRRGLGVAAVGMWQGARQLQKAPSSCWLTPGRQLEWM